MKVTTMTLVFLLVGSSAQAHPGGHPEKTDAEDGKVAQKSDQDATKIVVPKGAPQQSASFLNFPKSVGLKWDEDYLYVESNGLPDHKMMVGITAWQQQIPLPQQYTGDNAWRIPLKPVPAKEPMSAKTNFFRGAIALAANGVPIFNPIKNDGVTDTLLAGELDQWGGHCGRADDYHYHIAPIHLQETLGKDKPLAYALDGYPIYGYEEPDGSAVTGLDELNGHKDSAGNYHYHATKTYPYINGGFFGQVTERNGQVDPQPRAEEIRPAARPLRGAKITGFTTSDDHSHLQYEVDGKQYTITYQVKDDGSVTTELLKPDGETTTETYEKGDRPRGGDGPKADRQEKATDVKAEGSTMSISQGRATTVTKNLYPQGRRIAGVGEITATDGTKWTVPAATLYQDEEARKFAPDLYNGDQNVKPKGLSDVDIDSLPIVEIDADGEVITGYIFADNYFELYVNGKLVGIDPIPFTEFNSNIVRFRAKAPVTYAFKLVDWEENLGLGTESNRGNAFHPGDAGLIASFSDGTKTNGDWKAQTYYIAPLDDPKNIVIKEDGTRDSSAANQKSGTANSYAAHWKVPQGWSAKGFDDSAWPEATTYKNETVGVDNKPSYTHFDDQFSGAGASFIWTSNLVLDNLVLVRFTTKEPETD